MPTDCRACGEPTCFTFALKLVAAQKTPAGCPPLQDPRAPSNWQRWKCCCPVLQR